MTLDEEANEIINRLKGKHLIDIENGILTVDIIIHPVKAVEYIYLPVLINEKQK